MKLTLSDFDLREYNTSIKYTTGSVWPTNNCGPVTIIGQLTEYSIDKKGSRCYRNFVVQFEDGTYIKAWNSTLKNGKLRNPYRPVLHGVGFIGQGKWCGRVGGLLTPEYSLWSHMLRRCYDEQFHKEFPTYKVCTVDPRWHNFQLFCEDIQKLKGYNKWVIPENKYQLDKDIKIPGNKHYSLVTCMFVSPQENTTESNQRNNITGKTYEAYRLADGYTELFYNMSEFARKYKLQASNVGHVIAGKPGRKTHKGWKFYEKKEGT